MSTISTAMITIDDEFRALIPPLTDDEFRQLEASILAEGVRDPLVVWEDILLDGHHRMRIADNHGILYEVIERELPDRNSAMAWIIKNQFARRNLTPYQRCELALKLKDLVSPGQGARRDLLCQNSDEVQPIDTKRELAKMAGVSHDTISKVKKIQQQAGNDTKERLRRGETTINREYKRIVQAERRLEQVEATKTAEIPQGAYQVIAADPPWSYRKRPDDVTQRGRCPYPTMTIDEISSMSVPDLAHEDCILWLWTTNSHMAEAHQVAEGWGFTVKTILTWVKNRMGVGDWLRGQTEHCLMCVKGKPVVNLTDQTTVLHGALREHSRKPEEFFKLVEELCPATARLADGRKLSVRGGKEGLFYPADLQPGHRLRVAEGPTDAAALLGLGFQAVGRPSCTGGVKALVELVCRLKPWEVAIFADNDQAGQRGAERLLDVLPAYSPRVCVIYPPADCKDVRQWIQGGANRSEIQRAIDEADRIRLLVSLKGR